jgi:hypothetical protein
MGARSSAPASCSAYKSATSSALAKTTIRIVCLTEEVTPAP